MCQSSAVHYGSSAGDVTGFPVRGRMGESRQTLPWTCTLWEVAVAWKMEVCSYCNGRDKIWYNTKATWKTICKMFTGGSKWTLCRGYNSTWHLLLHIVTSLFLFYSPDATPGVHMAFWTPTSQFYFIHVLKKDHGPGEPFKAITGIFCSCCSLKIYLRNCNFFLLPIYRPR